MPVPSSGEIQMTDIYNEFTGTHTGDEEIQMSDYRGDGDVPSGATDEIQLATDMYGASDVQATPYTGYQITYGGYNTNIKWGVTQNAHASGTMQYGTSWGAGRGAIGYDFRLVLTSAGNSATENYRLTRVAYGKGANYGSQYSSQYQNVNYAARICPAGSATTSTALYNVTGTTNFSQGTTSSNRYAYDWFYLPSPGGSLGTVPTLDIGTWYSFYFKLTGGTPDYGNWSASYAWCESGATVTLSNGAQLQLQYRTCTATSYDESRDTNFVYIHHGGFSPASYGSCSNPWMGMSMAFGYPYAVTAPNQG